MNEKKEIKNHIIKISVLVIAIVVLGVSLSYAYYSANKKGTSTIDETSAARLDLSSSLTTAQAIDSRNLTLIESTAVKTDADKVSFTVTNASTSTVNGKYHVYLTDVHLTKNLYSKDFKWQLVRVTSSGESEIATGNFADSTKVVRICASEDTTCNTDAEDKRIMTDVKDITLNSTVLTIAPGTTDNLLFRIWLENDPDVNQVDLTEGTFQGKLKVEVTPTH